LLDQPCVAAPPHGGHVFWCQAPSFVTELVSSDLPGAVVYKALRDSKKTVLRRASQTCRRSRQLCHPDPNTRAMPSAFAAPSPWVTTSALHWHSTQLVRPVNRSIALAPDWLGFGLSIASTKSHRRCSRRRPLARSVPLLLHSG
jgi:hypothetical protein